MKNKYLVILTLSIALSMAIGQAVAQRDNDMIQRAERLEEGEPGSQENDTVVIAPQETDTTTIRLGNRIIRIIEKREGGTDISIFESESPGRNERIRPTRPFRGNWRGLELGLNSYLDRDFSMGPEEQFMELHSARSLNLNLNFLQYSLTISDNNIGLVTGLGLEMNNYRFANPVSITKIEGIIAPIDYDREGINLIRSRLRTHYLTVPLLVEFQTNHPRRSQRAHLAAGVIGGLNIGSNTRVVYRENSRRSREKVRDDFYLRPFRYGLTVRAGYRALNLYANFYPSTLFQTGRGPVLYPVSAGFSLVGF